MTLLQNQYVFSKATNKIFIYIWAPFILQNFLKILRANPKLRGCAIFKPKIAHLCYKKLFGTLLLLSSTYCPFSLCKILKKFLQQIQSYEDVPFLSQKWSVCSKQNFFGGVNYQYYFHLPIGPFHCANFLKNFYSGSRVMRMDNFWVQNGAFTQKSNINLLMKHWRLKNIEISLAIGYNLITWFFPSMQFSQNVSEPQKLSFYTN